MISCAKCGSAELLVMRTRLHVDFVRRWFGLLGKRVPRMRVNTLDLVCSECLYAFVANPKRVIEAPSQAAHDQLLAIQRSGVAVPPVERNGEEAPKPPPRSLPARPASDPRVRRR